MVVGFVSVAVVVVNGGSAGCGGWKINFKMAEAVEMTKRRERVREGIKIHGRLIKQAGSLKYL